MLVADHWYNIIGSFVESQEPIPADYALYAIGRIISALEGETDPDLLGLDPHGNTLLNIILQKETPVSGQSRHTVG